MRRQFLALGLLLLISTILHASVVSENRKGNKAFEKKNYPEAIQHYRNGELEAPEKKEFSYNLGNSYYRSNDFESALKSYERAKSIRDPKLKRQALFNAGNALYRAGSNPQDEGAQQKLEQASKMYQEVLKSDPLDQAAKFNLQKTLERIEMQKQQQQQNKDNKDNKDNKENKDQQDKNQDSKNQQDKDKKDQNQKEDDKKKQDEQKNKDQKQNQDNKDEQKPAEQKQSEPKKPGQMSEEEAKRLLDAMKQNEEDMQKKLMRFKVQGRPQDKDW